MQDHVEALARLAAASGLDGVVASPLEIALLRQTCGPRFIIVTPGIRARSAPADDPSRTPSAREARAPGSTYLVVGRPIVAAADPRAAADQIAAEAQQTPTA